MVILHFLSAMLGGVGKMKEGNSTSQPTLLQEGSFWQGKSFAKAVSWLSSLILYDYLM
jgi:hypothetical protein